MPEEEKNEQEEAQRIEAERRRKAEEDYERMRTYSTYNMIRGIY